MVTIHGARRNTNRAEGYDYSENGSYFVTVCTHELRSMFGYVIDGEINLNRSGQIAAAVWENLPERFPLMDLDAFVIMPKHLHGIVIINEESTTQSPNDAPPSCVRAQFIAPLPQRPQTSDSPSNSADVRQGAINCARTKEDNPSRMISPNVSTKPTSLGNVVRVFKAVATDRIRQSGMSDFRWHRNYYDHIIRNEKDLDRIRAYIANNPMNWPCDKANRKETINL